MSIETQIAVVEQEMDSTKEVLNRLENAIDKISNVTTDIGKILAVHEQRLERGEKATNEVFDILEKRRQEMSEDIKELHSRITTTTREISAEISDVRKCVVTGIDDLKKELKEDQKYHNDNQAKLEKRIAELEKWRYMLVGAGIVGGAILTKIVGMIDIVVK